MSFEIQKIVFLIELCETLLVIATSLAPDPRTKTFFIFEMVCCFLVGTSILQKFFQHNIHP